MLIELHAHTSRHSKCSVIDPVSLVREAVRMGMEGILLTDHGYLWPEDEIMELRREAGVERHFRILSAQEVDTDFGHVIVIGADRSLDGKYALAELRASCPGAALIWAHPYRNGKIPPAKKLLDPALDAVEIFSLNQSAKENYLGLTDWHRYKFTAISGSDAHSGGKAGTYPAHLDHRVTSIAELIEEIRRGRCRPFFKEILRSGSDMTATEVTIGPKGADELRQRIIVKSFSNEGKWEKAKRSASLTEKLSENGFGGGTFRVPRIVDIDEDGKVLIEEGQRGKNLHDVLSGVSAGAGREYFRLAGRWLAKLHSLKLRAGSLRDTRALELKRLGNYEKAFIETNNPRREDISRIAAFVRERETAIFEGGGTSFAQLHGDYHPKNIIIGQDRTHDPSTLFISVIDFNSSLYFCPAFDVGYFLVQFKSQLCGREIIENYTDDIFIDAYLGEVTAADKDIREQIEVFKLRASLNIASYFVKVGLGESREVNQLIDNAHAVMDSKNVK